MYTKRHRTGLLLLGGVLSVVVIGEPQSARELTSVHNFRDVGGYATGDGHTIRKGVLYRSADLADMSEEDRDKLRVLGIRYEIDLRGPNERALRPSRWGAEAPTASTPFPVLFDPNAPPEPTSKTASEEYADLAIDQAANIASALGEMAQSDAPVLLHCAAGNDRTGVTVAVLMAVLGVPREEIIREYLRSNEYWTSPAGRKDMQTRAHMSATEINAWPGLTADTLNGMFQILDRRYGSFDGYRQEALKLTARDEEQLRVRFLQENKK